MRMLTLVLSLFITANADAGQIHIERGRPLEPVESERLASALRDAYAVFSLPDGSRWVTHKVPARMEPSPIAVTRFGPDGSARVFLLSDWLPEGAIPQGRCGQVYGVALLDDGRIAVAGGWNDGADSHNAILILHRRDDGGYATEGMFEVPGVNRIVGGPRNTILAITDDPAADRGGALLTLYDLEGHAIGKAHDAAPSGSAAEAVQNAGDGRLLRISKHRFALYDRASETVFIWDLDREGPRGSVWTPISVIFVGDDAAIARCPVVDIYTAGPDEILLARTGLIGGSYKTQLTIYAFNHAVKDVAFTDYPWKFILSEPGRLRGIVMRGNPHLDTVALRPGK